jgi:hypothetical protein
MALKESGGVMTADETVGGEETCGRVQWSCFRILTPALPQREREDF